MEIVSERGQELSRTLASERALGLLEVVFGQMATPPSAWERKLAGGGAWHLGGCRVLAEGLRLWLRDPQAELWGMGQWTEPAPKENGRGFHHRGYWDYVDHVLLGSGGWLLDASGVWPQADRQVLLAWHREYWGHGDEYGLRRLADLPVSLEEEGIWAHARVSASLARLLGEELGQGQLWLAGLGSPEVPEPGI